MFVSSPSLNVPWKEPKVVQMEAQPKAQGQPQPKAQGQPQSQPQAQSQTQTDKDDGVCEGSSSCPFANNQGKFLWSYQGINAHKGDEGGSSQLPVSSPKSSIGGPHSLIFLPWDAFLLYRDSVCNKYVWGAIKRQVPPPSPKHF